MSVFDSTPPLLPEILALHGKWRAQQQAVICESDSLDWQELCSSYHALAAGLLEKDVKPGDRIAVVMSNGIPMLQTLLALMSIGVASVPINLSVADDAIASMITDADVVGVIATDDQSTRLDSMRSKLPDCVALYLRETESHVGSQPHWDSLASLARGQSGCLPQLELDPDSILNVIYSSGTTGLPKGIVHSQRGRRDWAYDLALALRYHSGARTLLTIGLYSNISWVAMLTTLLVGGTLVIHRTFDARAFLETVEREKITHTAMVPVQFQRVIEAQRDRSADLSSMQSMMSCGSPLHQDLKRSIFEIFNCGIIELYGLTEGIITTLDPESAKGRWNSVGKPLLGTDILIVDDDDEVCEGGVSGEIVSRGRITMPGYLGREEATRKACFSDESGRSWLRSGDIGYLDEEGFLYIVDRKKDMILSGGQNVYPQDIEAVLVQHATVNDVAVIGVSSRRWGETPIALVVLAEETKVQAEELLDWANSRLGKQQRLADIRYVEELPRNPNGKILKRELRQAFSELTLD